MLRPDGSAGSAVGRSTSSADRLAPAAAERGAGRLRGRLGTTRLGRRAGSSASASFVDAAMSFLSPLSRRAGMVPADAWRDLCGPRCPASSAAPRTLLPRGACGSYDDVVGVVGVVALLGEERPGGPPRPRPRRLGRRRPGAPRSPRRRSSRPRRRARRPSRLRGRRGRSCPDEQVALVLAGGDAEVGVAGLARAVHDAAHHRHLERDLAAPRAPPAACLATAITSISARPHDGQAIRSSPLRSRSPSASSSLRPATRLFDRDRR